MTSKEIEEGLAKIAGQKKSSQRDLVIASLVYVGK
jgi:hypothetical protein